ncbi:hypothetical protein Dip510_001725 [Elusimicrobium posterum]|uniref:DUF192 domain-containing protein n=1 Tax=Elusimicrobium posterum TaxID=3116653 RepID=UPI003C71EF23
MIARNENNGFILAENVDAAKTLKSRLKGLLGRSSIPAGYGLHIVPCNSIHMFFMRFAIDAVFISKEGKVMRIYENFKPWRMTMVIPGAYSVLELPAGTVKNMVKQGDIIKFI